MFEVRSFKEGYCIFLIAVMGIVIGLILGIGNSIVLSIPFVAPTEGVDRMALTMSNLIHGGGLAIVWGVGLGGLLGGCRALISRGNNWTDWMKPNGGTFLGVFPT